MLETARQWIEGQAWLQEDPRSNVASDTYSLKFFLLQFPQL